MHATKPSISQLILEQLDTGEMRILTLVVAVRKALARSEYVKGDLSALVNIALRKLVTSRMVIDSEGTYSLNRERVEPPTVKV